MAHQYLCKLFLEHFVNWRFRTKVGKVFWFPQVQVQEQWGQFGVDSWVGVVLWKRKCCFLASLMGYFLIKMEMILSVLFTNFGDGDDF